MIHSNLNLESRCIHGGLTTDAVFVTRGGDWKLRPPASSSSSRSYSSSSSW